MQAEPLPHVVAAARRVGRVAHVEDWAPQTQQEKFLRLSCFEALYGGAAGGGKSDALLIDALSFVGRGYGSAYSAILFRRTFPELDLSLIRRSRDLYPRSGGVYNESKRFWRFATGETIHFGHLEHENDVHQYQGAAFSRVAFDELTSFTQKQYEYLFSRVRSAAGVPCGIRAATNPGNVGHDWVKRRFRPWVSRKAERKASPGQVLHFRKVNDADTECSRHDAGALGRTFIPARLEDNAALTSRDPGYRARLDALDALTRAQLLGGDWDAALGKRDFYNSDLIRVLRQCPHSDEIVARCRAWDFGATADGDPSAGVRLSLTTSGLIVIEHAVHFADAPDVVEARFAETARRDLELDARTQFSIPEDPGAAGKTVLSSFQRRHQGWVIYGVRPQKDKVTRFRPFSARALAGNVAVVDDGSWDAEGFHNELNNFPLWSHDDRVDATSDAYARLVASLGGETDDSLQQAFSKGVERRDDVVTDPYNSVLDRDAWADMGGDRGW